MGNNIQHPHIFHKSTDLGQRDPIDKLKVTPDNIKLERSQSETSTPREKSESQDTQKSTPRDRASSDLQDPQHIQEISLRNTLFDFPPQNLNI